MSSGRRTQPAWKTSIAWAQMSLYGVLRGALLLTVVVAVGLAFCVRGAHARVGEALLGLGSELQHWQHADLLGRPQRILINGTRWQALVQSTRWRVPEALDRVEECCEQRGGLVLPEALRDGPVAEAIDALPVGSNGVFRFETPEAGVVACFDLGGPLSPDEMAARLRETVEQGDLSLLGKLRYVRAEAGASGTTLVWLAAEGSIPLRSMFPAKKDAPGQDPPQVPRPPNTRRLLSAGAEGGPYWLAVYAAPTWKPKALSAWLMKELTRQGWQLTPAHDGATLLARTPQRSIVVRVSKATSGGSTLSVSGLS